MLCRCVGITFLCSYIQSFLKRFSRHKYVNIYTDVVKFQFKFVLFQIFFCSVIRCVEISSLTERTDKFRLCLFEHGVRKHIGEKEITALVLRTKKNTEVKVIQ